MWIFVEKKKRKTRIWLFYSKMTKKILAVHIGNRGKKSAKKLINQVPNMKIYSTDDWDAMDVQLKILRLERWESVIPKILNDLIFEGE